MFKKSMYEKRPIFFLTGRFVFSVLVVLLVFKFHAANADASRSCEIVPPFYQTIHSVLQVRNVEMIARNHDIGLYRGGTMALNSWIEVEHGAYLGIDREGRLLNVIQLPQRNIAFLLSGQRVIKDIFLKPPSNLFAIDKDGNLLRFNRRLWDKSDLSSIVRGAAQSGVDAMCAIGVAAATASWFGISLLKPEFLATVGLGSAALIMVEGYRGMHAYEDQNQIPDGFDDIGRRVEGWRQSDLEWSQEGFIHDYILHGRKGAYRLSTLIEGFVTADLVPDFNRKCEYDMLARGIPPENYEP
jgi:hypothetical protein